MVVRVAADAREPAADAVAVEAPLAVRVRGETVAVTMRTPGGDGDDAALAAGLLLTEGLVRERRDITGIACLATDAGDVANVTLRWDAAFDAERLRRRGFVSSSCGVCGKASLEAVAGVHPPLSDVERSATYSAAVLTGLPDTLRTRQAGFDATGGLHAAGLFDAAGGCRVVCEDVGRHNAVDKAIGRLWLDDAAEGAAVLCVSGRVSVEIVQKALALRVGCVVAVSAPTSLAVAFAAEHGQVLCGFVRGGGMNVYTHAGRIHV